MSQLEIKHLKLVCAIARTANMTRAAESLFVTQSALSQQLKEAEMRVKAPLFIRTGRKMVLTGAGRQLHQSAVSILQSLEDAELAIEKSVSGHTGTLKVGTQCVFCYKWLPEVMRLIQEKYQGIELSVGSSANLIKDLETNKFDFVISGAPVKEEQLSCQPLFTDSMVCIMAPDNILSDRQYVRLEDFADQCLIAHRSPQKNVLFQAAMVPQGIEPSQYMCIEQPQAIIEMVKAGFGVSILPRWAVRDVVETGKVTALPITGKGIGLTWQAIFLKNGTLSVVHKEFVQNVGRLPLFNWQPVRSTNSPHPVSGGSHDER